MAGCVFHHDQHGNLLRVELTSAVYGTLTTVYIAARESQTRAIESNHSHIPSSLANRTHSAPFDTHTSSGQNAPAAQRRREFPNGPRARLASLFMTPEEVHAKRVLNAHDETTTIEPVAAEPEPGPSNRRQHYFPRRFEKPIPDEVTTLIESGVYFLRAWRRYRKLTTEDAAELYGASRSAIEYFEQGYNAPRVQTLERFANAYDCTIEQLTPASEARSNDACRANLEQPDVDDLFAPPGTSFPDHVLAHIRAGKSPAIAWRLFRGLTIAQCADRYGVSEQSFKQLNTSSPRSRERLAVVLSCKPAQLLLPPELRAEPANDSVLSRTSLGT
jgi:transcriptional regulator with XRE-family HTH domain